MAIERRITGIGSHPVRLDKRADTTATQISGYGAMFYDGTPETEYELWSYGSERAIERLMPTAFDAALERPDDVRGLFNHDANLLLGRSLSGTMTLTVDDTGLHYAIDPGDTTVGRDVSEHLKRGDVTGSSFAFVTDEESWTESRAADGTSLIVREIRSVTLYDVGPVVYPAYEATTAGLRIDGEPSEAKRSFNAFRAATTPLRAKLASYRARAVAIGATA